tara:strand:- start:863 stop:1276 length:414 start_codon:yes stop_codon:yes gene_type:complete
MSQPDDGRYKSRGRKERTPEQLKVLAMAREKAKLVIAEKTKIKKEMASAPEEVSVPEPVEEPAPEEVSVPEPIVETPEEVSVPEPVVEPPPPPPPPPPPQPSMSRDEIQNLIHSTLEERRTPERKYAFVDGMYVKIK